MMEAPLWRSSVHLSALRGKDFKNKRPAKAYHFAGLRAWEIHCCRNAGIGTGILNVVAAVPIPFWHPLGGNVQAECVP